MNRTLVPALLLALAAPSFAACKGDVCAPEDVDCLVDHLVLMEPRNDGPAIPLVTIDRAALAPLLPAPKCTATSCNGKCVNLAFDPQNCGACGTACAIGARCLDGQCACPSGQTICDGACVDLQSDFQNCGACNNLCHFGTVSSSSSSSGAGGTGGTGGTGGASSTGATSGAGGAGGTSAGAGGAGGAPIQGTYCQAGTCVAMCSPEIGNCNLGCVETSNNRNHCGNCSTLCSPGETCNDSFCVCTDPDFPCGCIDPVRDHSNCGGCGIACSPAQTCEAGVCWPPLPDANDPLAITKQPLPIAYVDPSALRPFDLDWRDPDACQPALCAEVCEDNLCSSHFVCTATRAGDATGTFRSFLGFLAATRGGSAVFTLDVFPISAPGCPTDLLDRLATSSVDGARVGAFARVPIELVASSTLRNGEARCTDADALCTCPVSACATESGCSLLVNGVVLACGADCNCAAAAITAESICCPTP